MADQVTIDAWLPVGFKLPDGAVTRRPLFEGSSWQIVETQGGGRALIARQDLTTRWVSGAVLEPDALSVFTFGEIALYELSCGPSVTLTPVSDSPSPRTKAEALAFATALHATRSIDPHSPLQDAIYVERFSRLLPTYAISARVDDDVILGYWLTGGANVSARSFRRLGQMLSWLGPNHLADVVRAAGFDVTARTGVHTSERPKDAETGVSALDGTHEPARVESEGTFRLPGRPLLEAFFNEHVIDILQNRERYRAFGIEFPSAIVLHGPPGCGKTFAVERLVDFLAWPSFQIEASSVASPYIHETSRKVAEVFDKATKSAPSVLVIDEMEAFLADRELGEGHHRVEEVAEFLRRIPEAAKNEVLIIAMTNRVELVDPAILRRGRFDHIIKVDYASAEEVRALLTKLLSVIPKATDVDPETLAARLEGRPLSDVTFVVREGARLAARAGRTVLDQSSLLAALTATPARDREGASPRKIGFV